MFSGLRLAEDIDSSSDELAFRVEVLAGLSSPRKRLSPKWFYDAKGSDLFEAICDVPEYYPTRQEIGLFRSIIQEIALRIDDGATLIELGSGASIKTKILLDAAPQIKVYKPIEISQSALDAAAANISKLYPKVQVIPQLGDFTSLGVSSDDSDNKAQKICFFPGSTIGNFAPDEAIALMGGVRGYLGPSLGSVFIVGVDLAKDSATLEAAYDDAQGVTAEFNLNILTRINRELNGNFDLKNFAHRVQYNRLEGRVEMHLEALVTHDVTIAEKMIHFSAGETIHTECSYKHTVDGFTALARRAGWGVFKHWISPAPCFAIFMLTPQ
jgi:dimethylhistidine N-methyltransferase